MSHWSWWVKWAPMITFALAACTDAERSGVGSNLATVASRLGGLCDPTNPIHNCPSVYCSATSDGQAGLEQVSDFGPNPGNHRLFKHVPGGLPANAPLVVALHACDQNAAEVASLTGWNDLADEYGFAVIYPEQKCENNAMCCFNWAGEFGDPTNLIRGQGENQGIIDMIDTMIVDHDVDPGRVYVTGPSGGGAMANLMMATWPDRFEAGATMAGVPYYCTDDCEEVSSPCLNPGKDRSPQAWGDLVINAYASVEGHVYAGRYPRLSIWHGTLDTVVSPNNLREQMEQWTAVHGIDQAADASDTVKGHAHLEYQDASGVTLVETYEIQGGQHAIPVDPGNGEDQCGSVGSWTYDKDICSTYYIARFFGLLDQPEDQPPSVRITEPSDGVQVSGTVVVRASASDDVGVDRVEFRIDGQVVHTDSDAPYEHTWDADSATTGSHTIGATAYDTVDQTASDEISVVKGIVVDDPPVVVILAPGANSALCGVVTLAASASDDLGVERVEFLVDGQPVHSDSQAPYLYEWDTDGAQAGNHTLGARALDTSGQEASASVGVRVGTAGGSFAESFGGGTPDNGEWELMDFSVDPIEDHTGGDSAALHGAAEPDVDFTLVKKTSVRVQLGSAPVLSYFRKLDMSCGLYSCGFFSPAAFRVKVQEADDPFAVEDIIDFVDLTEAGQTHVESTWTDRSGIDLSAWAGQAVLLNFYVGAPYSSHAWAWIDDVVVSGESGCVAMDPPAITIDSPGVEGCCVQVTGTMSDPGGYEIVLAALEIAGHVSIFDVAPDGSWEQTRCNLANGTYTMIVTALNEMGALATREADATITDCAGSPPEMVITLLTTNDDCVHVEGSATDPDGDDLSATLTLDAESPVSLILDGDGGWNHDACGLAEGAHVIVARAVDAVGLERADTVNFTIGAGSSPVLTIGEVSTNETCVTITGTVVDPDGGLPAVTISVDGGFESPVAVAQDGTWSFERCQLALGDHEAAVKAVDAAGLQDRKTVDFTITGETGDEPEVTIDSLETSLDCVHVEGTAIDPHGEGLAVTARIDGGSPNPVNLDPAGSFTYDRCLLTVGMHTITILAINRSGLRTTVEQAFEITGDAGGDPPVVTIGKLTTEEFCVHIEGTATDPDGDSLTATISIDQGSAEPVVLGAGGSWVADWCGPGGDHVATVRAEDPAGNFATASADFRLEGSPGCGCSTRPGRPTAWLWLASLWILARRKRSRTSG